MVDVSDVWADDFMGRKPSSKFLTTYLLSNPHIKVLNVNSPWGSGKSFFLERWKADLRRDHVCILFNAWATDYSAEPLVALVTSIEQQTKDKLDISATDAGRRVVDLSSDILKKAAPLIAKGLVKKFIGVEFDDLLGKDGGDDAADVTKDLVASLIDDQSKTTKHVEDFKRAVVERLSQAAMNNNLKKPAFIFIDELDRCRPTYAIELLERIKHFFEIEDCRFIIASDSTQLAHAIRAVYGQGFSSERYLSRFFDAEFSLDNSDVYNFVYRCLPDIKSVSLKVNVSGSVGARPGRNSNSVSAQSDTVVSSIAGFSENAIFAVGLGRYFGVELRELGNYIKQIKSAADTIGDGVHFFWLSFLVFLKSSRPSEYANLWRQDVGVSAIAAESKKNIEVSFAFPMEVSNLREIAIFYYELIGADRKGRRGIGEHASSWRESIYDAACEEADVLKLRSYKEVVELAHRLS